MYPQRRRRPLGNRTNVFSVPRDSVERACRPLRKSHHRTWFTMDALLATARRPVSDRGETQCRGEPRRRSSRHRGLQKKRCRSGIIILHMEYRQSPKAIDGAVSAYLAKRAQIADPEVARFGQLSATLPRRRNRPKFHMKIARASGPDQTPPRGD